MVRQTIGLRRYKSLSNFNITNCVQYYDVHYWVLQLFCNIVSAILFLHKRETIAEKFSLLVDLFTLHHSTNMYHIICKTRPEPKVCTPRSCVSGADNGLCSRMFEFLYRSTYPYRTINLVR